ncbi:hypothetical protein CHS0354_032455 [Potamilus streckersoni]|uniref:RxLR effector protein n=1 Tax=Potamilus streckersoni TaxID=2493646 RepID=A0AAE0SQ22_9BIVA|nr:hypothetical protein CHS0354_032455 [Potamilus streckersoni]
MRGLTVFLCVFLCMTAMMMGIAESGTIGSEAVDAQDLSTNGKNEGVPAKGDIIRRMHVMLGSSSNSETDQNVRKLDVVFDELHPLFIACYAIDFGQLEEDHRAPSTVTQYNPTNTK